MDDIDDEDDQPRVVYVDPEREGRLARYAATNTQERRRDSSAVGGVDADGDVIGSKARGGLSAGAVRSVGRSVGEGGGGVRAGGVALWASDDESEGVAPSLLIEEEDDLDAVEYVAPCVSVVETFEIHLPPFPRSASSLAQDDAPPPLEPCDSLNEPNLHWHATPAQRHRTRVNESPASPPSAPPRAHAPTHTSHARPLPPPKKKKRKKTRAIYLFPIQVLVLILSILPSPSTHLKK